MAHPNGRNAGAGTVGLADPGRRLHGLRVAAGNLGLLALLGCPQGSLPPLDEAELGSLVQEATFIFEGTVVERAASTVSGVARPERAAIARVERVHRAPGLLRGTEGRRVTVLAREPRPFHRGTTYLFFTRPGIYGRGIAVREIRSVRLPEPGSEPAAALQAELRERPDRVLKDFLATADLVVSGEVIEVAPVEDLPQRPFVSEHYPDWRRATVRVASVERGRLGGDGSSVTVLFPASRDVMWYAAPKLQAGQRATWILTAVSGSSLPSGSFAALRPADVRPPAELPRIRRLLGALDEEEP